MLFGAWLRPLTELPLLALLALLAAGMILLGQRPLDYRIDLGREDGPRADLPFVVGWNTAEVAAGMPYRWTRADSHIDLVGLPRAPFIFQIRLLPTTANPRHDTGLVAVRDGPAPLAVFPMVRSERMVRLLVPAGGIRRGRVDLGISAPTWTPPNDPRTLGVPFRDVAIVQVAAGTPLDQRIAALPIQSFWPLIAFPVFWLPLRRWGPRRSVASALGVGVCFLLLAAYGTDRLRFALAAVPALAALAWALVLALALHALAGRFTPRLGVMPQPRLLNQVALLFFGLFTLRYLGRLYPDSMVGDLGFHVNREDDVIRGTVLLLSRHRGIDFPYPPALYVLLLPFRLLPITPESLVEFGDAFFGALGLFPLAYLSLRGFCDDRVALWSTTVYALLAPAMMSLWWSFLPHIFAQELSVVLIAGIIAGWPALATRRGVILATTGLTVLFATHFGFYLNVSVLLVVLALLALADRRARLHGALARGRVRGLLVACWVAQALILVFFYSAYVPLFISKLSEFRAGGMGAVQGGRTATPAAELWRTLWRDGLGVHYATIGVPLALLGGYQLLRSHAAPLLRGLFAATLIVAVVQGAIPFLTSSTITTRWLSFAAWLVAVGVALVLDALWRRGRAGKAMALLALGWIGWTTVVLWIQALAFRVRPPEPF